MNEQNVDEVSKVALTFKLVSKRMCHEAERNESVTLLPIPVHTFEEEVDNLSDHAKRGMRLCI